ncbi:hypothetical protein [Amycolatopsis eburnea]|uniref:Uncharacterized protein n=1 Tax=Amycolatopsis eburnea TaxID=2267691 RepID=A0A427TPZ4_9PSEU|nr:hypothetical protein [Amycolatopsis eburnea]RSD26382.1 hypothetical protein EIY87_00525 [Amycolatopsis eburnea]
MKATVKRSRPGLVKGRDGKSRWSAELLREQLAKYTASLIESRDVSAARAAEARDGDAVLVLGVYEGEAKAYAHALSLLSIMTLEEFGDDPGAGQRAAKLKELADNRAARLAAGGDA